MSAPLKRLGIVVAVDGSPASNAATCWAARDAAMRNIPLTVVSVVTTPTATYPPVPFPDSLGVRLEDQGRKTAADAVKIAEDAMPTDRKVAVKSEVVFSTPAQALVKMSDEAEMVVVGSSGKGMLARGLLGSVSSSVVRSANCPVAVIRDEDLLMPDPQHAPVLVGIDGSPASELATEIAFDQASHRGVELIALHAWSDVCASGLPGWEWSGPESESSFAESLVHWQERYPNVRVQRVVVCDEPARQLIEKSESAQLVVVGSRGRGAFNRMMLGSVSNTVLHSVRIPVIVARPS
jgi:nucleotide-binding universal stress UspA family protein